MKNSLFVGSFNPITVAHENISRDLIYKKIVDQVYFLPVNSQKKDLASINDRINMINLLKVKNKAVLNIYDFEKNGLFNYDVLKKIASKYNITYIIMGSDLFLNFHTFNNYKKILDKYFIIIINRMEDISNYIETNYSDYTDKIIIIRKRYDGASSLAKENLNYNNKYLEKEVLDYIKNNNLYN